MRHHTIQTYRLFLCLVLVMQIGIGTALSGNLTGRAYAAGAGSDGSAGGSIEYPDYGSDSQPGGTTRWYAAGSFNGWNNADAAFQFKHLAGGFYTLVLPLDPGTYEFKLTKNGTWDGFSNAGNNFSMTLGGTAKTDVRFYINEELGQARISVPGVENLAQYVPAVPVSSWPRLVGDIQTAFGEPAWNPAEAKQMFVDYNFDGTLFLLQRTMPAGKYEAKVAMGGDWTVNYGANGLNGSNLALNVLDPTNVTFALDLGSGAAAKLTHDYKPKDQEFDGQINKDAIVFDSRSVTYKKPFGAIEEGKQDLTLRIAAEAGDVEMARAELTDGSGLARTYDMAKATTAGGKDYFEAVIPKSELAPYGVWSYKFILIDGSTKVEYGDDGTRGGKGAAAAEGALPYDLTVYKAGFSTPDWIKDAVVYQLFVDRFFDGDSSNNRAKAVDGVRGVRNDGGTGEPVITATKSQYFDGGVPNDPTPDQVWGNWSDAPENPDRISAENKPYYPNAKSDGVWSNEFYGGDIEGIGKKLDYLKSIGITAIYLNPVAWAASNHKYDATDYKHLDPMFGEPVYNTPGDPLSGLDYEKTRVASDRVFSEFAKQAMAKDIRLIMDGVFNHVGDDSIYFDRYEKYPEIGAYEYWAKVWDKVNAGISQPDAEQQVIASFTSQINPLTGVHYAYPDDFTYTTWFTVLNEKTNEKDPNGNYRYKYDAWWGYDSLPVMDAVEPQPGDTDSLSGQHEWNNVNYREEVIGHDLTGKTAGEADSAMQNTVSQRWAWLGASGWRLDVAPDVSAGTWEKFRDAVKSVEGRTNTNGAAIDEPFILGEEWGVATKFLLGDQFDSVMNYRFRGALQSFMISGDAAAMNEALESIREDYPKEAWQSMLNLVDSHDTTRNITKLEHPDWEEEHLAIAGEAGDLAMKRQALTALFQLGYPGAPTIYYGDEVGLTGTKDPDSRKTFPWERVQESGGAFAGQGTYGSLLSMYQKAAAVRHGHAVFSTGDLKTVYAQGDVIAYARKNSKVAGLVMINRGETAVTIEANTAGYLPEGLTFTDALGSGAQAAVASGKIVLTIPALTGYMMLSDQQLSSVADVQALSAAGGNGSVKLAWDEAAGADRYNVYRAAIEGGDLTLLGSVPATGAQGGYTDTAVTNGTKYYYAVTAAQGTAESAMSAMVSALPAFAVNGVAITAQAPNLTIGTGKMTEPVSVSVAVYGLTDDPALAGKEAKGLEAKLVYYNLAQGPSTAQETKLRYASDTAGGEKVYWASFEPTEPGTYAYFAKVSTNNGESFSVSPSVTLEALADTTDTAAPEAPVLQPITVESNRVQLNWTQPAGGEAPAGHEVFRQSPGDSAFKRIASLAADAVTFTDFAVSNDKNYVYYVTSYDAAYNRAQSGMQAVTPKLVMVDVTLRLHIPTYTPTTSDIFIAGDLNGWNASGGKLNVPSGATTREVVEYKFKMMAGKSIQYKYTRGSWDTEAFTSHTRSANDTTDYGNWAYSSTDTNMRLTIQNQGSNQMIVDDYVLRWVDMPMIITMPRQSFGEDIAFTTDEASVKLKAFVPYGAAFTINGQPLAAGAMDAYGNVNLDAMPLAAGVNTFVLHIEPTAETLAQSWYADKGRANQATKTITMTITRTSGGSGGSTGGDSGGNGSGAGAGSGNGSGSGTGTESGIGTGTGAGTGTDGNSGDSAEPAVTFPDLQHHWAKDEIERLSALGIVKGRPNGWFDPQGTVTRAEFAALLVRAVKLNAAGAEALASAMAAGGTAEAAFKDVPAGAWYAEDVNAAYALGLVTGLSTDRFAPNERITRQQIAVMMARAAAIAGFASKEDGSNGAQVLDGLTDRAGIAAWADEAVRFVVGEGLMQGDASHRFHAESSATRAEAAVVLARLLRMADVLQ
ncbi:alpha-amylase family glycosyl hydrolase [Paenibacillus kobensis]|uniref:alpha-amylase family glycosyl hydrolase n=1 Tax=Paenibacillus kobensis TaxID=59841 RepID=UPI001FE41972|nr:alpha-amylase family glycosyl hydrolase [Paenibacillus kobensis]